MAGVLSESALDKNGPNDHFGQNDVIPNWISAFARPKWTKMVHFGPFWSESPGPPGPKSPKSLKKVSPGLSQKVSKSVKKRLFRDFFETF